MSAVSLRGAMLEIEDIQHITLTRVPAITGRQIGRTRWGMSALGH